MNPAVVVLLCGIWALIGFSVAMAITSQRRVMRIIERIKTMDLAVVPQGAEISVNGTTCFTTAEIAVRVPVAAK